MNIVNSRAGDHIPPYSGWTPRSLRLGKSKHEIERGTKRSRLGNREDRMLYKSSKGHKTYRYIKLCQIADGLNGIKRMAS